jgi:hypothetical protein
MTVLLALIHLLPDRHKRRRSITQLPGTVKARLLDISLLGHFAVRESGTFPVHARLPTQTSRAG